MTTIPQYVKIMRDTQWDIAKRLGADISATDQQTRIALLSNLSVQAVLIKLLVDKGIVTDAELLTAVNALRSSPWQPPREPPQPAPWDTTPVTGV